MGQRLAIFDVGGVLIRICHTWKEAAELAGVSYTNPNPGTLAHCEFLDAYQNGSLSVEGYLEALRSHLGAGSSQEALAVHNHILVEEYPGILDVVLDLKSKGWKTACLSNTAQLHWDEMGNSGRFPAFEALDCHFASHIEMINKPDPAIFLSIQKKTGISPEDIFFFDDYARNITGAAGVGWRGWVIDASGDPAAQIREHLAEFVL